MAFHVPNEFRIGAGIFGSEESIGNNGAFEMKVLGYQLMLVASDGGGWEHVSVSIPGRNHSPSWPVMCEVKKIFWDPEDLVVQYHPRESDYVNFHQFCLHLWRPVGVELPTPPTIMVGPKI
jgi:hypothetical protein